MTAELFEAWVERAYKQYWAQFHEVVVRDGHYTEDAWMLAVSMTGKDHGHKWYPHVMAVARMR